MTNTKRIALIAVATASLIACTSTVVRRTGITPVVPPQRIASTSTPRPGTTIEVQRGDTLYGIAFRNGVDVRELAAWNGLSAPYTIYPGQSLRLYPRSGGVAAAQPAPTTSTPGPSATSAAKPPTTAPPRPAPTTAVVPVLPQPVPPATVPQSSIRWRWPADGPLLSRFVAGEPTKQGIDVGGASGASVKAAADGVVVYSGSGLVGYGELVIIKHNDAWLSAYGHNRARMVNEGAVVKAGQQIAVMGRTGAPRDMLHFEIRYNGKPVDPLVYLPKR
jgi:lipoprotein NlpD